MGWSSAALWILLSFKSVKGLLPATITTIVPSYGPEAGGTTLTIYGHNLSPPQAVMLGQEDFYLGDMGGKTSPNATVQTIETPARRPSQPVNEDLLIRLSFHTGGYQDTHFTFRYHHNPNITSIYPLRHLTSGGTILTVKGNNLDAVWRPIVTVTLYIGEPPAEDSVIKDTIVYHQICIVKTAYVMECPLPEITLPPEFARETDYVKSSDEEGLVSMENGNVTLSFRLGFQFDGYRGYNLIQNKDIEFCESPVISTQQGQ